MRYTVLTILIFVFLFPAAYAGESPNYSSNPEGISSSGGEASSESYAQTASVGTAAIGEASSEGFTSSSGSGYGAAAIVDTVDPSINDAKFDGREVLDNDYINNDATLTAAVTDNVGISPAASYVGADTAIYPFSTFTGDSSYDLVTGSLTYKLDLAAGTHTITIHAQDLSSHSTSYSRTLKVESGALKASSAFIYPQPYNPTKGKVKIAYQLNRDADVSLYIFNEINQLVWKRDYPSGTNGGRIGYNEIEWNGVTDFGAVLGSGVYFCRIVSGQKVIGKIKMAVLQ